MVVNSQRNLNFFPNNTPFKFWTHLNSALNLKGKWKIALVNKKLDVNPLFEHKDLYIFCDLCSASVDDGNLKPLLRRICLQSSESGYYEFLHLLYVDVIKSDVFDIQFLIKDAEGDYCSFINKPVTLQLHFKSYPFFA